MSSNGQEEEKKQENYILSAVVALIIIAITYWLFPGVIPFSFFEFWRMDNNLIYAGIKSSWILFCWGTGVTFLFRLFTRNERSVNEEAEKFLTGGFWISTWAGIVEEILFRWIFFFSAIALAILSNFLFFGLSAWIYDAIVAPVSNFITLGKISGILYHPLGWFIGSAVIAANAKFRDGHKYLGWFGYVNSWFVGIFLFWILFQYGLPACIAVHFLYDFFIFIVCYIDAAAERALGF